MDKGYLQIYTGDGKGKTTAAFGLALRAAGAGMNVYIGQFLKNGDSSEVQAVQQLRPRPHCQAYGENLGFLRSGADPSAHIKAAQNGLHLFQAALQSGDYDLLIADEILGALSLSLLSEQDLCDLLDLRSPSAELVLTGRNAPDFLIDRADLVTEMRPLKHYYSEGVTARLGIEM